MNEKALEKLKDPDVIWEGIGPDGVRYPMAIKYSGLNDPMESAKARRAYDDDLALKIGNYAREWHEETDESRKLVIAHTVGYMLITQLLHYVGAEDEHEGFAHEIHAEYDRDHHDWR